MKKFATILLLVAICLSVCSCNVNNLFYERLMPLADDELPDRQSHIYKIYVYGAVADEGYYYAVEGATYSSLVISAGLLDYSLLPGDEFAYVDGKVSQLPVCYYCDGVKCYPVNVNGAIITYRLHRDEIPDYIIDLIATYIETNGKITDKTQLKEILGDYYDDYYYRFYVDRSDYEKID